MIVDIKIIQIIPEMGIQFGLKFRIDLKKVSILD